MKKIQLSLLVLASFILSCSKMNVKKTEENTIAESLNTDAKSAMVAASPAGLETTEVIGGADKHSATCSISADTLKCEPAFEAATPALAKVIKNTGGTNIQGNPEAMANLQTVFNKIHVVQYISKDQVLYKFKSNATGVVLNQRSLKVSAGNPNVYNSSPVKPKSGLTTTMLAQAAKSPTDANIRNILSEVYDAAQISTTINR